MKRGKRKLKKKNLIKDVKVKRKPVEGVEGGGDQFQPKTKALAPVSSLSPSYLPKRKINIRDISPDELMFAHEWANNYKEPDKALLSAGITKPTDPKSIREKLVQEYTTNAKVIEAFKEAMFNKLESIEVTSNRIDSHLSVIAFTDRGLIKAEDGSTIELQKLPWEVRQCVQEFEERMYYPPKGDPYKKTRIKFYSTVEALRILRKNKKEDKAMAAGMAKVMQGDGSTINIQNNYNSNNRYHSGNVYNSDIKQTLDLSRLDEQEINILLKAMGKQIPKEVQELEADVNVILEKEAELDKETYPEPEPVIRMRPEDVKATIW